MDSHTSFYHLYYENTIVVPDLTVKRCKCFSANLLSLLLKAEYLRAKFTVSMLKIPVFTFWGWECRCKIFRFHAKNPAGGANSPLLIVGRIHQIGTRDKLEHKQKILFSIFNDLLHGNKSIARYFLPCFDLQGSQGILSDSRRKGDMQKRHVSSEWYRWLYIYWPRIISYPPSFRRRYFSPFSIVPKVTPHALFWVLFFPFAFIWPFYLYICLFSSFSIYFFFLLFPLFTFFSQIASTDTTPPPMAEGVFSPT